MKDAWELIEVPENILSVRFYPAVVAINDTEIAILGGYDREYYKDVYLFNKNDHSVKRVAEDCDGGSGYYANTNQAALIAHEEVVVLTGRDGNKNPSIITWKKGQNRIEQIRDIETEGFPIEEVKVQAIAAPAKVEIQPARMAKAATPPLSAASAAASANLEVSEKRAATPELD